MHLQAERSVRQGTLWIAALLLVCGSNPAVWAQFSNAYATPKPRVQSQPVQLQDGRLLELRGKMRDEVDALPLADMLQAANHGDAKAMRNLACMYWDGLQGHDADAGWGLQWFERAAVAGNIESLSMIGDHYATGADGDVDFGLARLWYTKGYAAKDARATVGLAEISCQGAGVPRDIVRCGSLLDQARSFMKPSDALDVRPMVAQSMFEVAGDYHTGAGIAANQVRAAAWYAKSAALGRPSAAVALSKLYVEPGGLPQDLARATAVLDGYLSTAPKHDINIFDDYENPARSLEIDEQKSIADTYVEIGAAYEKTGSAGMPRAIAVYRKSAGLGYPDAMITLGLRYAQGEGLPQNLAIARSVLTGWDLCLRQDTDLWARYGAALQTFNALVKAKGGVSPIPYAPCPFKSYVLPASVPAPFVPLQPRYPTILTQDTVAPMQTFPVMVSLNLNKLDASTKIVSATNAENGMLMVVMPEGMTSILIEVSLVAAQMTATDGKLIKTIEMRRDQDSTTAVFQMQAGSEPGVEPIFATLTYNGDFLATIEKDVTVAGTAAVQPSPMRLTAVTPALPTPAGPPILGAPAPVVPATAGCGTTNVGAAPVTAVQAVTAKANVPSPGFALDPEARAADITIEELRDGPNVVYTVRSPLFPAQVWQTVEPNSACRKTIVDGVYSLLESKGAALAKLHRAQDIADAKDVVQGQGDMLYDRLAPDAFKTVYQKLKTLGAPPKTISVLTEEPLLPWELMRPKLGTLPREDFLGLTLSVVHRTSQSAPAVSPPKEMPLDGIAVVMPQYSGTLDLTGAGAELDSMTKTFPGLTPIPATLKDVKGMAKDLPNGIIHYAGHGIVVPEDGAPPQPAIVLNDGPIVPETWLGLTEDQKTHPFYFFNACDLGQSFPVLNYVSGWGPTLMKSGASGYLGAMWKVSDKTAASFSAHFYADLRAKMDAGVPYTLAQVVSQARRETYAEMSDPTALAYVLYSAPYQTLRGGEYDDKP
jgi:TPR repeat protein